MLFDKIMVTVAQLKISEDWIKENGKYIPYPATWLNAKGWEDEISQPLLTNKQLGAENLIARLEGEEQGQEGIYTSNGDLRGSIRGFDH
jgi:hypothetical protein